MSLENNAYEEHSQDDTIKNKYLTFIIEDEIFGIDIAHVMEIIPVPAITWMPENPEAIKGIINLRGSIIPVIDVRLRFEKEEREYDELTCIIVIEYEDNHIGMIVDTVNEVLYIPKNLTSHPPNAKLKYQNKFIKAIGKVNGKVQLLLDLDKFLYS
ncbi:MAG: chemotaxis protein CheW [Eubacteriales bacterium]|nr:chemotaxis protein CheW [Eubacteriales bacterium]